MVNRAKMNYHKVFLFAFMLLLASTICLVQTASATGGQYRDLNTFMTAFKTLAAAYPAQISYETVGKTIENRDIVLFKIGNPRGGAVLFDGAMHGEENLGSEVLYSYAKWLMTSSDPLAKRIVTRTYTLLVPALDADEFRVVRTNANHVDLNRNFATNWQYGGSSDPASWYYRGPAPLSEPESKTIINLFQRFKPSFYLNLHRGGSVLYTSSYGNSTYYSILKDKINTLSNQRSVTPYGHTMNSGPGYSISDAARAGITSYLWELVDWTTTISLSQIETVILPRVIPVAAILSQEHEAKYETLFEDDFESGSFRAWNGTYTTTGETATIVNTAAYNGSHSAMFKSNGYSGFEQAYCYTTIQSASDLYAYGSFMITSSGIKDNDDRFYLITLTAGNSSIAKAGWRQTQGTVKWTLILKNATGWTTDFSDSSPSMNKWHRLELHWVKDATKGHSELYIDGTLVCSILDKNTAAFGNITEASFGLVEAYNCGSTTLYCDSCILSKGPLDFFPQWDLNQDGFINVLDLNIVVTAHGSVPGSPNWNPRADLNGDKTVNILDLVTVASHIGE